MKTSYRKASEMSGFYRQPESRAAVTQAIAAGSVYIAVVLALTMLFRLPFIFPLIGTVVGLYFMAALVPFKKWPVYLSGQIDEEFEL